MKSLFGWSKILFFFSFLFLLFSQKALAVETGNSVIDRLYTGQIKDDTGLYYYNARYYDPQLGIFTSADRAQGPNRYAYVGGNPIMRNDPGGNEMRTDDSGGSPGETWGGNIGDSQRWRDFGSAVMDVGVWTAAGGLSAGGAGAMFGAIAGAYQASSRLSDRYPRMQYIEQTTRSIGNGIAAFAFLYQGAQTVKSISGISSFKPRIVNEELKEAMELYKKGDYSGAIRESELTLAEANKYFEGFVYEDLGEKLGGATFGSSVKLNSRLSPNKMASLAVHEASHVLDSTYDRLGYYFEHHPPGAYPYQIFRTAIATEARAYATEFSMGGRSLESSVRNLFFSLNLGTTTSWQKIITALNMGIEYSVGY